MSDFIAARRMMVDGQVRTSDVTDLRLLSAMLSVPRERFVPDAKAGLAYLDLNLPVNESDEPGTERRLLKPMVLAKLIQAAEIGEADRVLDIGCATGYSSAVLGRLARSVVALEQDPVLVRQAQENLAATGAHNVTVVAGPMVKGWQADAPYDVIILNGATEIAPGALFGQLKKGGRLIGVVGHVPMSKAMLYRSDGAQVSGRPVFDAVAPLLPGFAALPEFVF